jgi:GH24 family phage-related lysozyme (muramidase)
LTDTSPPTDLDPDGNPTIGWGHLCCLAGPTCSLANCTDIPYHIPLCKSDGQKLLLSDLSTAEACVAGDLSPSVVLNPNQYGALVSWAFNVGCGNVASSTLVAELNAGQDPDKVAAAQLPKWVYGSNDEILPGLVTRRAAEVVLFQSATDGTALPPPCS